MDDMLLSINFKYLLLCTLIPIDKQTSNFVQRKLFSIYKYFNLSSLFGVWLPFLYEFYLGEREKFIDYSSTVVNTGGYLCSILTLFFFLKYGGEGRKLIEDINVLFKRKCDDHVEEVTMDNMNQKCKKITIAFLSLLNLGVLSMTLLPLVLGGRKLPTQGVYPGFNPKNNTMDYVEIYLLQTMGQLLIGNVTSSSDTFFICVVLMSSEQVKIIAKDFHNCLYNALINHGVNKENVLKFKEEFNNWGKIQNIRLAKNVENPLEEDNMLKIMCTDDFKKRLSELMISYIKHHQRCLEFFKRIETFFLPLIFMKVCVSIFYHVFITFAVLSIKETSMALILSEYEMCALAELFIFALAGQALIDESELLRKDLVESPWYICDIKYQKLFYMVLMRSGQVSRVSVGKLTNMCLPTFLLIMKTAVSYLAVLRQVVD